jgi:hypothetical protein
MKSSLNAWLKKQKWGAKGMGWAGGSEIAEDVWIVVRKHIPLQYRKDVARKLIDIFEDADCDTIEECKLLLADADLKIYSELDE